MTAMVLAGRTDLMAQITAAVEQARDGRSHVLVLEGEAGHGKSAVLTAVRDHLPGDVTVLVAAGHQAESDIGHAGLHQLLRPVIDTIDSLDEPHRSDLMRALSLGYGPAPTRLAVGQAVLLLLARVAASGPVVALVDDVHWLDRSSLQALVFAARRLDADGVCFVFASRPGEELIEGLGTILSVDGLDAPQSARLLRTNHPEMSSRVVEVIAHEAGGLPLALVEIPRELTAAQRSGEAALPDRLPLGPNVERLYANRLASLSPAERSALLLASLDDHSATTLEAVLQLHDLSLADLATAERLRLVRLENGTCVFDHPTVRSAVRAAVSSTELAAAHREVAGLVRHDPVRLAFHLTRARSTADVEVLAALVAAAEDLDRRGSRLEAGRCWEEAAEVCRTPDRRREYWARAAEALARTSDVRALRRVVGRLIDTADDRVDAARWHGLRTAALLWSQARQPDDVDHLIDQGVALLRGDEREAAAGLDLLHALVFSLLSSGRAGEARRIVELIRSSPASAQLTGPQRLLCDAVDVMVGADGAGAALRGSWLSDLHPEELDDPSVPVGYFGSVLVWLADVKAAGAVVNHLRTAGRSGDVALVAAFAAAVTEALRYTETGEWDRAVLEFTSAEALAGDADYYGALNLLALWHAVIPAARGDVAECERLRTQVRAADTLSHRHLDGYVRGLLSLSRGEYETADQIFAQVRAVEKSGGIALSGYTSWFADWVEARWHLGRAHELNAEIDELAALATRTSHPTMAARAARCQALVADDFDTAFARAAALHDASPNPYERARTELAWGRMLRRSRRRGDARIRLESALSRFEALRATAWVERTRAELAACGVRTVDEPDVPTTLSILTPREFQVAREVAAGATNAEAANRLFVSPRTVEYHLSNTYRKLGITERHDLTELFAESR